MKRLLTWKVTVNFLIFLVLFANCKNVEFKNVPFKEIINDKIIPDGKYPNAVYFLNSRYDTLKNLKSYSNVWVIVENNSIKDIEFQLKIPGRKTTDKQILKELAELDSIEYFLLDGDLFNPHEFNLKKQKKINEEIAD